jgi:hypothetical protein
MPDKPESQNPAGGKIQATQGGVRAAAVMTGQSTVAAAPTLSSVALRRIIEEVRSNEDAPLNGYNRVYHRHNR